MLRRLMIGLSAGALLAAMLPGVASAEPMGPPQTNFGACKREGMTVHPSDRARPATRRADGTYAQLQGKPGVFLIICEI